jgi:RND family efflux transporter MFP subunit
MVQRKPLVVLVTIALAALIVWLWIGRKPTEAEDPNHSQKADDVRPAAVVRVERGTIEDSLTIAGAFKPFQDVDVHAKVSGYIRAIYVDVGTHVKEGQTLAVLEAPELVAELAGADAAVRRAKDEIRREQGDVERAKSAHSAAHAMYDRLSQAAQQRAGLVAQQELDDAQAKDLEAEAQMGSTQAALNAAEQALAVAEAKEKQYRALSSYTRITAPFTGVITTRFADTGALIAAGTSSSTQSMAVVRIAQISVLRLVLPVPESMAAQIHLGDPVKVHVQALNQDIVGKVSRFANALDLQTRTMETEIDFENKDRKLLPGMFAETVLQLAQREDVVVVPLEAVSQGNGEATVLAVNAQNVVDERHVKLGLQGKTKVEVITGLKERDLVIIGNRSAFRNGERVAPKEVRLPDADKGGAN